jgi:TolB protein
VAADYPAPGTQTLGIMSPAAPTPAGLPSRSHARSGLLAGRGAGGGVPARTGRPSWTTDRRKVIAAAVALAVLVAGAAYLATGSHKAGPAAGTVSNPKSHAKSAAQMLPAGHTGTRSSIPWSLTGPGWTVAETSTAAPNQDGQSAGGGSYTTYLVDPEGGKYQIATTTASTPPELLAWSGDAHSALYATPAGGGQTDAYSVLSLSSGQLTALPLPAGVSAMGFTRPDGLNILAVRPAGNKYKLQRYNLQGAFQATLATMGVRAGQGSWSTCGSGCGALSSPDGDTAVWGIAGDEMQLVSNAGGIIRKLHVPDSGKPPSCAPVSWWSETEVLADCAASGGTANATELWLVPTQGGQPSPLTAATGSPSGSGVVNGAWQSGSSVYATVTSAQQCPTAASGPGGLDLVSVSSNQSTTAITIPHSTGYHASIVQTSGKRLLLLAQTTCPGTSSLMWYDPASNSTQTLLSAPSGQVGVIAAVPYGNGPTAISAGQS